MSLVRKDMEIAAFRPSETERRKQAGVVYETLRRDILGQRYAPGERLSLEEIARENSCGATQVKNAVQLLASEGLVEIRPRSGTYVAGITIAEVEDMCDIRRALECLAAETAVLRVTPELMSRFRTLVHEMDAPVESEEQRQLHEKRNTEFHRLLVAASGNGRLLEVYEDLKSHIQFARLHAIGRLDWKRRLPDESQEHAQILNALQIRDSDRLKVVLRRHIDRAKGDMVQALSGVR